MGAKGSLFGSRAPLQDEFEFGTGLGPAGEGGLLEYHPAISEWLG